MIEYRLQAERRLEPIERLCGEPFESGVGLAGASHPVDHIVATVEISHHLRDTLERILKVGIYCYHRIYRLHNLYLRPGGSISR